MSWVDDNGRYVFTASGTWTEPNPPGEKQVFTASGVWRAPGGDDCGDNEESA